jgi:polyisoprenyl-phosphate glycosyltransferase
MHSNKKTISVVSGCLNEEANLSEFYDRVLKVLGQFPDFDYEIIVADNCSTDGSRDILRRLASQDPHFKVILNANNFGPIRSGYNAFMQASGDAVVLMAADLQDPPELIADMLRKWEEGYKVVAAIKSRSKENPVLFLARKIYYRILSRASESTIVIRDFTGFGLYDRRVMEALKRYSEPLPYLRGLVSEIGFRRAELEYVQPRRKHGRSKHNLFTLYDVAVSGFVSHSKLPLRLATFSGFCLAGLSLTIALAYFIYKLLFWSTFALGLAPLVIGLFFFSAVQLIFIGIIGEYIGAILTQVKNHPLTIEDERINFDVPVKD